MDRIDILLEKYFQAQTTLTEEAELKDYFSGQNIKAEHLPYKSVFDAFEQESRVKMPKQLNPVMKTRSPRKFWIQLMGVAGAAAAVLVCVWLLNPQVPTKNNSYALVSPHRNEDNEYAQKYTREKLERVNEILNNGMKPMKNLDKVRNSMQPINKIAETKEKLLELQNKLQIK